MIFSENPAPSGIRNRTAGNDNIVQYNANSTDVLHSVAKSCKIRKLIIFV